MKPKFQKRLLTQAITVALYGNAELTYLISRYGQGLRL